MLPLTHRDHASAVSFVAGQCKGLSAQDWSGLAGQGRTLVIYMGVATARDIGDKLMADGVSPAMPVAVLERGEARDVIGVQDLRVFDADAVVRGGNGIQRRPVRIPDAPVDRKSVG